MNVPSPLLIGWQEWCALPELGVPAIKAKVDTGARTSALHAFNIQKTSMFSTPYLSFSILPLQRRSDIIIHCQAPLIDERMVTDSGGHRERRFVIRTLLILGPQQWPIDITLTDRFSMRFRMLLGRNALASYATIDPNETFLLNSYSGKELRQFYFSSH